MIEFDNPLCAGRTDEFYPPEVRSDKRPTPGAAEVVNRLREICRACPHQRDCHDLAVERYERFGVWGGVHFGDGRERAEAHRRVKRKLASVR